MKERKEKIDLIIERNTAEQLAGVDWDKLNEAILSRLDKVERGKISAIRFPAAFKIAASFAVAAAVILAVVMFKTRQPEGVQLQGNDRAIVKFIKTKGSASVEIKDVGPGALAMVSLGRGDRKIARCEVKIIDLNGDLEKETVRASWIIIRKSQPLYADNGFSRDMRDIICLF